MREILFRAKRDKAYCPSQDWTYGVPFIDHEGDCIFKTSASEFVVDPETVGQYTGLTDKNGKKIFEGDIVRTLAPCSIDNYVKGVVMFGEYPTTYQSSNCGYYVKWQLILNKNLAMYCAKNDIEIIGNIHDNPELLKGE